MDYISKIKKKVRRGSLAQGKSIGNGWNYKGDMLAIDYQRGMMAQLLLGKSISKLGKSISKYETIIIKTGGTVGLGSRFSPTTMLQITSK